MSEDRDISDQVAALAARLADIPRPAANDQPEQVLSPFNEAAALLWEIANRGGFHPRPLPHARAALDLAVNALTIAASLLVPLHKLGANPSPTSPTDVADVAEQISRVGTAIVAVVDEVQHQLAAMHVDALHGRITGPPSSNPAAEVERVIGALIDVHGAAATIAAGATDAYHRALRLAPGGVVRIPDNP